MERESFEDQEVAAILNANFVSIKVDREERPDVDGIYMSVCQAMTGQGGWPLTVVMTPEKKPFFVGTYFPKHSHRGRPGLVELLLGLHNSWQHNRAEILKSGNEIVKMLQGIRGASEDTTLSKDTLKKAYSQLEEGFDEKYGGFGTAPKFPTPHNLMFLLRYWKTFAEEKALFMVERTLTAMWQGGIYDHLGYGFARYSMDQKWLAPHFEKMLYDNALLGYAYLEAYQCTENAEFAKITEEILTYVLRDMTSEVGGFYCAEDADSEGVEGKFYVFTRQEVLEIMGEKQGTIFANCYNMMPQGNFENDTNILNRIDRDLCEDAERLNLSVMELEDLLAEGRDRLYHVRKKRIAPYKDDKILTSWNALMIITFAKAAQVLNKSEYARVAEKALEFIYSSLMRQDGRLLARYREEEAAHLAYLDDYAFLVMALIETYEATFVEKYLQQAVKLATDMKNLFWDSEQGGFYFYGSDGEQLITRPKELYDGAIPSGNSVATLALQKLADITGDLSFCKMAEEQLELFAGEVLRYAAGYTYFMMALDYYFAEKTKVIIVGIAGQADTLAMLDLVHKCFLPGVMTIFYDLHSEKNEQYKAIDGQATAYVCTNFACQPPITDIKKLSGMLKGKMRKLESDYQ